jgi:hypothetical protein
MADVCEVSALDDILDACIERLLAAGETLEQCLFRYPDHETHLKPLLETALTVREAFFGFVDRLQPPERWSGDSARLAG